MLGSYLQHLVLYLEVHKTSDKREEEGCLGLRWPPLGRTIHNQPIAGISRLDFILAGSICYIFNLFGTFLQRWRLIV